MSLSSERDGALAPSTNHSLSAPDVHSASTVRAEAPPAVPPRVPSAHDNIRSSELELEAVAGSQLPPTRDIVPSVPAATVTTPVAPPKPKRLSLSPRGDGKHSSVTSLSPPAGGWSQAAKRNSIANPIFAVVGSGEENGALRQFMEAVEKEQDEEDKQDGKGT